MREREEERERKGEKERERERKREQNIDFFLNCNCKRPENEGKQRKIKGKRLKMFPFLNRHKIVGLFGKGASIYLSGLNFCWTRNCLLGDFTYTKLSVAVCAPIESFESKFNRER